MSYMHFCVPLECDLLNKCWNAMCFKERHRKKLNTHSLSSTLFCFAVLYTIKHKAEKMLHSCYAVYICFLSWFFDDC